MGLEIFLFGRFEVRCNGEPLASHVWKNAKTQALFKILVGERGRLFSVDELIEYLWPEEELNLKSAASNLRNRVAELRKILEPSLARGESSRYIHTRSEGYLFSAEADCWLDTEEFTRGEEAGRRAQRAGQLEEAIAHFERAAMLYRGDYLNEDRYAEWALQLQERWRERYVEILSELAEGLAQRGRHRDALRYIERAVEQSPLQETLYRQWMVYAHCAGEAAQARRAYQRCREVLERELGERPSSRTEEIYRQIQQGQIPEIAGRYPLIAERSLRPSLQLHRLPFCGRRAEWQRLNSALQKAQYGQGVLVLICGEPGVGKTRLCEEFFAQAQEKLQAQILTGRCLELKNPLPLHPWLEALHPAVSGLTAESLEHLQRSWLAECAELLPDLRSAIPQLPQNVALPSEHRPYRLFETLFQILCALARQRAPLLVFLDDLQWVDEETIDLLCYLMDKWTDLPLMILATLRPGERTSELLLVTLKDHALRRQWLEELHLKRLTASDIQEMVAQFGNQIETTADVGERLYRESAGNPLFLSAILQSCFENGFFSAEGAHWRLRLPDEIQLPAQVLQLIEHRTARVGPAAQRVLQLIACAVQLELEVLERAWEGTTEELFAHLNDLMAQGILTERQGRYEFAHDKLREVNYIALEEPRKIWLHRRLAQALESLYADPTTVGLGARLAEHYERGGQPQKALEWTLKAIEESKKLYRSRDGLQLVTRGLKLLEALSGRLSVPEQMEKEFALRDTQAEFQLNLGELNEAQITLKRLAWLAQALRDDSRQAKVHLLLADWHEHKGQYHEELLEARRAQDLYRKSNNQLGEARALFEASLAAHYSGDSATAINGFLRALQVFESLGEQDDQIGTLENLALAYRKEGKLPQARECLVKALQLAVEINALERESDLWYTAGSLDWQAGRYQAALDSFQRAHQIAQQVGDRHGAAYALLNLSITYSNLGNYEQALHCGDRAESLFTALGNRTGQGTVKRQLGRVYQALNNRERAQSNLEEALQISLETDAPREKGECLRALGKAHLAWGEVDRALEYLLSSLALAQEMGSPYPLARVALVEALLALGDLSPALEHCQQLFEALATREWGGELVIQAHFQHYRLLKALGRPEAQDALQKAYNELQKTASQITDASLRASFLKIQLHQEILHAARAANLSPNAE